MTWIDAGATEAGIWNVFEVGGCVSHTLARPGMDMLPSVSVRHCSPCQLPAPPTLQSTPMAPT